VFSIQLPKVNYKKKYVIASEAKQSSAAAFLDRFAIDSIIPRLLPPVFTGVAMTTHLE